MIVSFPTHTLESHNRPLIPIQMMLPNGTWSKSVIFNFDTGASWATDVPLQLLKSFGGEVSSSERKEQMTKIRIPGLGIPDMAIPVVVQDKAHYDLFRSQSNRYPLCKVYDLMKYVTIIYEKTKTTIRSRDLGVPVEVSTPGTITMPPASRRSGTPTSALYWQRGTAVGPTGRVFRDWFNICTGDYRFIFKRSTCEKAGFKFSGRVDSSGENNATGSVKLDEGKPSPLVLKNITVTARDDDERFARGGLPRNLCGGVNFLDKWKIVIWDNNLAFVPV